MKKRVNWLDVFLYAYLAFVMWRMLSRGKPLMATIWYYYAQDLQRAARFFGEAGIGAELLYHDAMKRYSLAQ